MSDWADSTDLPPLSANLPPPPKGGGRVQLWSTRKLEERLPFMLEAAAAAQLAGAVTAGVVLPAVIDGHLIVASLQVAVRSNMVGHLLVQGGRK